MKEPQQIEWTVSNRTVIRVIGIVTLTVLSFRFLLSITHIIQLLSISIFLSLALNPVVRIIVKKLRLKSRVTATGIAYLSVILILGTFLAFVVPPLVRQTFDFVGEAPTTISSLKDGSTGVGRFVQRYNLESEVDGLAQSLSERTRNLRQPFISTAGKVGSTLLSMITVLVLTFMLLVEGPYWFERVLQLFPKRNLKNYRLIAIRMNRVVTGYVNGQLLLSVIGASFNFLALLIAGEILNVSVNAVGLAGILLFTGLIPMIGHVIGGAIVFTACLFVSIPLAIFMALFMLVYQQVENVTLQPYIQAKYNELTPLLVFVAALIGIAVSGLFGGLVAIPIAGCLRILYQEFVEQRVTSASKD